MRSSLSRRSVLAGAGYAAALGGVMPQLLSVARAAEEQGESAILLSMVYRHGEGAQFDAARFRSQHLPLLKAAYGDSLERIELRTPEPPRAPRSSGPAERPAATPGNARTGRSGPPPAMPVVTSPLLATASLWIRDIKTFAERTAANSEKITRDLGEVTSVQPFVQYDQVVSLLGDARSAISQEGHVFSSYFPASEGATFDMSYYGEKVIPMMVSTYGEKAVRRIEVTVGSRGQAGGKPAVLATAHYYIRDRMAWDAAGMQGMMKLREEMPKYTTIRPLSATMQVAAVG